MICALPDSRNVPRAGRGDLQKTVLGLVDGLLIHPHHRQEEEGRLHPMSRSAASHDDASSPMRPMHDRVLLNILPTRDALRGPEGSDHARAIMRKNFHGCTHIVIRRDHLGVGKKCTARTRPCRVLRPNCPDLGESAPVFVQRRLLVLQAVRTGRVQPDVPALRRSPDQLQRDADPPDDRRRPGSAAGRSCGPEVHEAISRFADPFS